MKRLAIAIVGFAGFSAIFACDKSSGGAPAGASPSSATSASASPSATVSDAPSGAPSAGKAAADSEWTGSYKSVAGALHYPEGKDWKSLTWQGDDASVGLGEGALEVRVDGATGQVHGTVTGPLGPATLVGAFSDGALTATIARQNPADRGLTGTAMGTVAGDKIDGVMNLSLADANVIRKATFTLIKKR